MMPDNVFTTLFQRAWDIVQGADQLLDLRDEMERIIAGNAGLRQRTAKAKRNERLRELGFEGGLRKLESELREIRTAAYIVIASISGCRNHELAFLRANAYYSTEDDDGELYWWMRSKSVKTDEGPTEWMVPEAAVAALQVMERWSLPFRALLCHEIEQLRACNPLDSRIAEAEEHLDALFLGVDKAKGNLIRTLSNKQWNSQLRAFAGRCGLAWDLASHQFRRKFANHAAKSQFGDLRYLKKHFKHWSMNMTLGYALNEYQEMALYLEVQDELDDIKETTVSRWLDSDTSLAGGYGLSLVDWRGKDESIVLFKNHAHMVKSIAASTAIRSNGHAWCTADDNLCVGNTLERTRCGGGCGNAVIGAEHALLYQGLYDHLATLRDADDIGRGGRARVERDLQRCAGVLRTLGFSPTGAHE
jgi:integrase